MKVNNKAAVLLIFAVLLAMLRFLLIDFSNFAPIAAAGIFCLYFLREKLWAIPFAIFIFFISDIIIHLQTGYGLYMERMADYFALGLGLLLAYVFFLNQKVSFPRAIGGAVLSSLVFFILSNGAVWLLGNMYPHNAAGLLECYIMGVPFYKGTLLGDVIFTSFFIGSFEWMGFPKSVSILQSNA